MKYLLLVVAFFTVSILGAQSNIEVYKKAKISYNDYQDFKRLEALGLPLDHGEHKRDFYIISDFSESDIQRAAENGFQVEILIDNVAEHFLAQNALRAPARNLSCAEDGANYQTPSNFNLGSMGGYLTYQELLNELDQMRALYPNLITAKTGIGNFLTEGQPDNSVTPSIGGNPIMWVKISDNPEAQEGESQILYSAIHHAREPASLSQLVFYMWYLLENYETNDEVKAIVDNSELFFVPVINPDGYLYNEKIAPNGGGNWRKNRKNNGNNRFGVDNNRNYDYYINGNPANNIWGGEGSSGNPDSDVYRGDSPFSEVENQAMKWFVEQHDFVMAFNNHTSGDLLLHPFGYAVNTPTIENTLFATLGSELVSRNGFNSILSSELYAAAGDSDDFMYGTVGTHDKIYAYTPEIGPSFWPPASEIENICKGMMYLNLTSSKMINNYAAIEDTTPLYTGGNNTIDATFNIRRLGIVGNGNFTVSLNPISTNIVANGNPVTFSNMALLSTNNGTIEYTVDNAISNGDVIAYELIVNNGTFDTKVLVEKIYGTLITVFTDQGNSVNANFNNNGWSTTTQTFVSPSSSITDSPGGNYDNNTNKSITLSNPIDLTTATGANVTFFAKWDIEAAYDYTQFEISIDNGNTWIPQCGNYTNAGSSNSAQPTGEPLYDGTQNNWVQEEINLSDYIGETILARFTLVTDGGLRQDGFYFDDLTFNITDDTLGTTTTITPNFNIYPNPVVDILNIQTTLEQYQVVVYNMLGQQVLQQANHQGNTTVDYSGLEAGLYLLQVTNGATLKTFKIIKK